MTTPDNGSAPDAPLGVWRLMLAMREAGLGELRLIEDMLLEQGLIQRRAIISQRQMKRLYEAFGEEAVKAVLAE
jgi:hypothetical protein